MARANSIYDHFDLYLIPVTLTFNLPEMFQMALLLLKGNKKKSGDDFHISDSLTVRSCTISHCIVCNYVNYIE